MIYYNDHQHSAHRHALPRQHATCSQLAFLYLVWEPLLRMAYLGGLLGHGAVSMRAMQHAIWFGSLCFAVHTLVGLQGMVKNIWRGTPSFSAQWMWP